MSGKALLSLFEEIIKLTPGENYPFHYTKLKLHPPLGNCPQGDRSPSSRNARVTPCPWGRQSWRTSDVGEQKCHPSSWVCGSWSSIPVEPPGAGLGPAPSLPYLLPPPPSGLELCFGEPNPSHPCVLQAGEDGRGHRGLSNDQERWREDRETCLFQGCCWQRWGTHTLGAGAAEGGGCQRW